MLTRLEAWLYRFRYIGFAGFTTLAIAALVAWAGYERLDVLQRSETSRILQSASAASAEISLVVNNVRHDVRVFAEENEVLIRRVITNEDDEVLQEFLETKVRRHFPDSHGVTVTDFVGSAYMEEFEGRIGDVCLRDIRAFADDPGHVPEIVIHPNPVAYHYDLMATTPDAVFFVSVLPDAIAAVLERRSFDGHQFMLVNRRVDGLIEVTARGSRDRMDREFRLSADELKQVSVKLPLENTVWDLVALRNPEVMQDARESIIFKAVAIITLVGVLSLIMAWFLHRMERQRKAAVEADRRKTEFLATVSHEIRNPMNSIVGMGQLLRTSRLDADQRDYVEGLCNASESLLALLNNVLDLSRIEADRLELEEAEMDLRAMADGAMDVVSGQLRGKPVDAFVRLDPRLKRLRVGDAARVRQVLVNLLGNAVKFTEKGHIVLSMGPVPTSSEDPDDSWVRFTVSDTGIGLTPEQAARLFKPFSQADASTARRFGGSGLGLSICHRLVDVMGGHIDLESDPGVGTRFWFDLPLTPSERDWLPEPDLAGAHVIVVSTDRGIGIALSELLEPHEVSLSITSEVKAVNDLIDPRAKPKVIFWALEEAPPAKSRSRRWPPLIQVSRSMDATSSVPRRFEARLALPLTESMVISGLREIAGEHASEPDLGVESCAERRVLVVDDDPMNRSVTGRMLKRLGCDVTTLDGGEQAIELLSKGCVDLVFMDCRMPGLNGFETTGRLRNEILPGGPCARLPIVAMTADALEDDRQRCLAAGMDDFITKPVRMESLRRVLTRWISATGKPAAAGLERATDALESPPASAGEVLDPSMLKRLRAMGNSPEEDFVGELFRQFRGEAEQRMGRIRSARAEHDARAVFNEAHGLKGAASVIGASILVESCRRLMALTQGGRLDGADDEIEQLKRALAQVGDFIDDAVADGEQARPGSDG
ncbi:MAG: ATP-binding protein [Gammaproteobacteria bacterium]